MAGGHFLFDRTTDTPDSSDNVKAMIAPKTYIKHGCPRVKVMIRMPLASSLEEFVTHVKLTSLDSQNELHLVQLGHWLLFDWLWSSCAYEFIFCYHIIADGHLSETHLHQLSVIL